MTEFKQKIIFGRTYRLHSRPGGCSCCVARMRNPGDNTPLCDALGLDCLKHTGLYWKEHIGIQKNSG